jgi:hypothetical protein
MTLTLEELARVVGGEISGAEVLAPGPGHSVKDRSLSVRLSDKAKDGFVVFSFSGETWQEGATHVREKLGMQPWEPAKKRANGQAKPREIRRTNYTYCDPATAATSYNKTRVDLSDGSKTFLFGKGRNKDAPLLYGGERLADAAGQPIFIVEGEKKVDRLRELGEIAVSGDTGWTSAWLPSHARLLRGLPIILWPDSDELGEKYGGDPRRRPKG